MSADRDTTRIVRSWLRTDEHESADRVLDEVLASLDTTPQRRLFWPSRRFAQMNNVIRIAIAAAAVVIVAVVGYNLLPGPGGTGGPGPTPTSTLEPTVGPTSTPPMLNSQGSLGGRFTVGSGLQSRITVEAPADWSANGDWVLLGPKANDLPDGMAIRFYPVENVFKNPLSIADGVFDPPVGPRAADLAAAIVGDAAWSATGPTNVTIGGRPGLLVQFAIPTSSGLGPDGHFNMFGVEGEAQEWGFALGQTFDLYIVDVGGERVVIDAFHYPGTSAVDLAAQQAVIDSIQIDPAE